MSEIDKWHLNLSGFYSQMTTFLFHFWEIHLQLNRKRLQVDRDSRLVPRCLELFFSCYLFWKAAIKKKSTRSHFVHVNTRDTVQKAERFNREKSQENTIWGALCASVCELNKIRLTKKTIRTNRNCLPCQLYFRTFSLMKVMRVAFTSPLFAKLVCSFACECIM